MYACTEKPVRTMADLDLVRRYEPGMPAWWPAAVRERVAPIRAALGDDGIVGCWSPHGPFNMASLLVDEQDLYCMFYTCLLYTSDAADDLLCVDLGGRR